MKSFLPEYLTRLDLTSLPFITIDGETAKDFDDAVYAEPFKDGGWRILIAIADVGHYVTDGSPVDIEAEIVARQFISLNLWFPCCRKSFRMTDVL